MNMKKNASLSLRAESTFSRRHLTQKVRTQARTRQFGISRDSRITDPVSIEGKENVAATGSVKKAKKASKELCQDVGFIR